MYDGIEYRGLVHAYARDPRSPTPAVPVWNGLTDDWHPTQMLADILTMRRPRRQGPWNRWPTAIWVTPATTRRTRFWSPGPFWAWTCAFVCAESSTPAFGRSPRQLPGAGSRLGSPHHRDRGRQRRRSPGRTSSTQTCGFRWASQPTSWTTLIDELLAYQVNVELMDATGNPQGPVPALFAGVSQHRDRGRPPNLPPRRGIEALEATEDVFESKASIVFDQAETGSTPSRR